LGTFLLYHISLRFVVVEIILKNVIFMACYLITRSPLGGFERHFIFQVLIKGAEAQAEAQALLPYGYSSTLRYSNQDNFKA